MVDHYLKVELYELVQNDPTIFEFLQAGSLDGLWYWDIQNPEHEWMSPEFKALFGYEDDEIPPTSSWWQKHIFEEDLEVALQNFEKHCADPHHPYDQIVRYRHKDGSTVWVRCRGIAIRDPNGVPVRMLGAHSDVTQLKEAEEALLEANKELEQFLHVASHDLREPLRMISSFGELLGEKYSDELDEEGKRWLGFLTKGAVRISDMVRALLDFSRTSQVDIIRVPLDPSKVLSEVITNLSVLIEEHSALIETSEMPHVVSAPTQLGLIFQNLLSNAIKFRALDREVRIEVSAKTQGSDVVFAVKDNGIGIKKENLERIFVIFQRLHPRSEYEGTGLGLAICEKLIRRLGGRIWVESEYGVGTTFFFSLPRLITSE